MIVAGAPELRRKKKKSKKGDYLGEFLFIHGPFLVSKDNSKFMMFSKIAKWHVWEQLYTIFTCGREHRDLYTVKIIKGFDVPDS